MIFLFVFFFLNSKKEIDFSSLYKLIVELTVRNKMK